MLAAHPFEPGVVVAIGLYLHQPGHVDAFGNGDEITRAVSLAVFALLAQEVVAQFVHVA